MLVLEKEVKEFKEKTEPLLEEISKLRSSTVVPFLFHVQANITPSIVNMTYTRLLDLKGRGLLEKNVDIILFSSGGDLDAAYHLGKIFQNMIKGSIRFIVPRYAKSAATLLACAGDELILEVTSELGPVDPQLKIDGGRYVSVSSLWDAFNLITDLAAPKSIERLSRPIPESLIKLLVEKIPFLELGDYERLRAHAEELTTKLLIGRMMEKDKEKAEKIAQILVWGFKSHSRALTIDEVKKLGLNVGSVSLDQWKLIWQIHQNWEKVGLSELKKGVPIVNFRIGDGIIFVG